jgi:hypothetical protein
MNALLKKTFIPNSQLNASTRLQQVIRQLISQRSVVT